MFQACTTTLHPRHLIFSKHVVLLHLRMKSNFFLSIILKVVLSLILDLHPPPPPNRFLVAVRITQINFRKIFPQNQPHLNQLKKKLIFKPTAIVKVGRSAKTNGWGSVEKDLLCRKIPNFLKLEGTGWSFSANSYCAESDFLKD